MATSLSDDKQVARYLRSIANNRHCEHKANVLKRLLSCADGDDDFVAIKECVSSWAKHYPDEKNRQRRVDAFFLDLRDREIVNLRRPMRTQHSGSVGCLVLSGDGRYLFSGGDDGAVRRIDLETDESRTIAQHSGSVRCLVLSGDGRYLFSGGEDGAVRAWNLKKDKRRTWVKNSESALEDDDLVCLRERMIPIVRDTLPKQQQSDDK